ncbi:MAG: hypothetical protein H6832_16610 [Planctomycetes bacterium]|nr:hypothetical protein [Planctomycetota bacterium]MCB9920026.1 hypothetical protein [Planctomycetota bacterium]
MWIWSGIVLASLSWSFVAGVVPAQPLLQWLFIAASVVCFAYGSRQASAPRAVLPRWGSALALLACAYCAICVSSETRAGFWLVAAGALGMHIHHPRAARVARSFCTIGLLLLVQSAALWGYEAWSARNPELPLLADVLHPILAWLGFEVAESGGTLFLNTLKYNHALPLTWNHLGTSTFLLLGLGAIGIQLSRRAIRLWLRLVVRITAVLVLYAIARFVVILGLLLSRMLFVGFSSATIHVELFWLPWVLVFSCLPLILILDRCFPSSHEPAEEAQRSPQGLRALTVRLGAAVMAGLGMALWLGFPDPGVEKAGRILIDESRGSWERSDLAYGPDWYGTESGYSYGSLAQHLEHFYSLSQHTTGELTPEILAKCDVLILKTPNCEYSDSELSALEAFVREGGGLFVLGEHSNVWGSSVYLNPVLAPYGIALRYDCVFDLDRRWEQLWEPKPHGRHPVTQDIPFFLFAVSCSLDIRNYAVRSVLRGDRLWTLPADYTPSNFYPEVRDRTDAYFGSFDQVAVASHGKGRVIAFTDSTTFSNFDIFDPGKSEFLLGSVEWLNRSNRFEFVRWGGLVLAGLGALFLGIWLVLTPGLVLALPLALSLAVAFHAGTGLCDSWSARWYPGPVENTPVSRISFDLEHCSYEIPIFGFPQDYRNCFEVFYMWTQRLGCAPRVSFDLEEALARKDPLVLIRPDHAFSKAEIAAAKGYVERGGRILVLDSPGNESSSSSEILALGGLRFGDATTSPELMNPVDASDLCNVAGGNNYWEARGVRKVEGGEGLLFTTHGETVASFARVGEGMILAAGFADAFANPAMGGSHSEVPDAEHRTKFEVEFMLIRALLSGDPHAERRRFEATFVSKE